MSGTLASLRASATIGTGRTDDTASIQAAINAYCQPYATGEIVIPPGIYRLTKPLVYQGAYTHGLTIRGGGSAAGPTGTVLVYDGPPGRSVIELRGCTSTTVERLAIDCGGKARAGVAIDYDEATGRGATGVFLDHLMVIGGVGPYSAAVSTGIDAAGIRDERQCDRIVITNSLFNGSGKPGTTAYGLVTGWANCKNFAVRDCGFVGFQTGIKFGGSGYMIVDGFAGGGNTIADFETATGNLEIRAGNSEHSVRMLTGTTGSNPGSASITGFSWSSGRTTVPDDLVISYQGVLNLVGNHFWNESRPDAVPRVQLLEVAGAMTALTSSGNFYQRASGQVPVVSWDGGPVRDSPVQSFGDFGGVSGQLVRLSGVLDYADGRRWTRDGLFNGPGSEWTRDGLYPGGGIKAPGVGSLIFGPGEGFRFVGWSVDKHGNRRQGWIVPPLKGK